MAAGMGDESGYFSDYRDSGLFCCEPLFSGKIGKGNTELAYSDSGGVMYCLLCSDVSVFPQSNTLCLFRRQHAGKIFPILSAGTTRVGNIMIQ